MDFPSPCLLGSIALTLLCVLSPFIAHLLYSTTPHREDLDPEDDYFPNPRDWGGH